MNKCSFYFNCSLLVDLCQSFWNVARHLEIRLPVSGLACYPPCHPERMSRSPERSEGEGSLRSSSQILREARDDKHYLQMSRISQGFLTNNIQPTCLVSPRTVAMAFGFS